MLKELLEKKREYLNHFFETLDLNAANEILQAIQNCEGTVLVTGVGKSGIIAKKIAMTMISTGTRALYLSPEEALHGDLGLVSANDLVLLLSKSGESEELLRLIPFLRNKKAKLAAIVSNQRSRLSQSCDLNIRLPLQAEICPFGLAPTTSTVIQLIFGDLLAVALMREKNFSLDQYALNHPSGSIGRRITLRVKDLMLTGDKIPKCSKKDKLMDLLVVLSNKQCGCILVAGEDETLLGIFTDGDLRRSLQSKGAAALEGRMEELMTKTPRWIHEGSLAWDALKTMEADPRRPITVLPVLDDAKKIVGILKLHDILQAGIS
jgi:arabinose-5-phosphate isomerase